MMPHRFNSGLFQRMMILLSFTIIVSCIITIPAKQSFDDPPLFTQIKTRVGLYYPGSVRSYTYKDVLFSVNFGELSVSRFDQIFSQMFSETISVPDWPPWHEGGLNVDAVIELKKVKLKIDIGNDVNRPDRLNVAYQICLFKPDATVVNCWDTESDKIYQRGLFDCLDFTDCFTLYLECAVRDAIAKFMLEFERDSSVHEWRNRLANRTSD